MSDIENTEAGQPPRPAGAAPALEPCIWPGCTRPRAPGRVTGSGRQKEYCLQADPPEYGGGPVHNARNRWAALRSAPARRGGEGTAAPDGQSGGLPGDEDGPAAGPGNESYGGGRGSPASVRDLSPVSSAKRRAGELLEQARRQHAATLASLRAERELYAGIGEQLTALADPAALDLEIATIASRAGRELAQAAEESARARRAQAAAERDRDEAVRLRETADAAAEQLAEDAAAAERALAARTAEFERDLADLVGRARTAEEAARRARDEATAVSAAARRETASAHDRAEQATAALAEALRSADEARQQAGQARQAADQARARTDRVRQEAEGDITRAREQAAAAVTAAGERARQQAAAAQARADDLIGQARADTEREREAARAAQAVAATAEARAAAVGEEAARLHAGIRERDEAHAAELARLSAAHQAALDAERALLAAERARAERAEATLDRGRRR